MIQPVSALRTKSITLIYIYSGIPSTVSMSAAVGEGQLIILFLRIELWRWVTGLHDNSSGELGTFVSTAETAWRVGKVPKLDRSIIWWGREASYFERHEIGPQTIKWHPISCWRVRELLSFVEKLCLSHSSHARVFLLMYDTLVDYHTSIPYEFDVIFLDLFILYYFLLYYIHIVLDLLQTKFHMCWRKTRIKNWTTNK